MMSDDDSKSIHFHRRWSCIEVDLVREILRAFLCVTVKRNREKQSQRHA